MNEAFVHTEAPDGLRVHGAYIQPTVPSPMCVIWVPGFGVSYELPSYILLGRLLAQRGLAFLSVGGRGQNGAGVGWRIREDRMSLVRTGSWYEDFEEAALDVEAWVNFARARDHQKVVLIGHSFGATKAVYHCDRSSIDVDGLVVASMGVGLRYLDAGIASDAERLLHEGHGEELLPAGSWPRGFGTDTVSAQTYASWWKAYPALFGEPTHALDGITCPVLAWYGTAGDVGGEADLAALAGRLVKASSVETTMLPGLRHSGEGSEELVVGTVLDWIARTMGEGPGE